MKIFLSLVLVIVGGFTYAQSSLKAAEDTTFTLKKRYEILKSTSQTFKDYKVIKEVVLDKVWAITLDSIAKQKQLLNEANQKISALQAEVKSIKETLAAQQASMEEVVYDSTHISVLGVPFSKAFFLLLVAGLLGGLVFLLVGSFGRMKLLQSNVKEKSLIADSISNEFDEYKKKAMEKQTKLSRELQNERNKLQELRRS